MDALAYDPHKFAMDYHNIGFRECAAEVARYLVTVEGMDIQDPLRLRLMSHLQCFAAQRELATKQATAAAAAAAPWGSYGAPAPGGPPPPPPPAGAPQPFHAPSPAAAGLHPQATAAAGDGGSSGLHPPPPAFDVAASSQCSNATPPSTAVTSSAASSAQSRLAQGQPPPSALTPLASPAYPAAQYHMNLNAFPAAPAGLGHHLQQGGAYGPAGASAQRTPYRPWGAELAY
ncbi:hypothetical protein R5R35_001775 [Gryllus longicercus]|uniref:Orange domain-containing protein n=1 Tax=Gryllus longicercus TaxID=2509291 RepID=A0AAN9V4F4_9ORTH